MNECSLLEWLGRNTFQRTGRAANSGGCPQTQLDGGRLPGQTNGDPNRAKDAEQKESHKQGCLATPARSGRRLAAPGSRSALF